MNTNEYKLPLRAYVVVIALNYYTRLSNKHLMQR